MTGMQKSLAYDAVVLGAALVVVAFTDGTAQTIAVFIMAVTCSRHRTISGRPSDPDQNDRIWRR